MKYIILCVIALMACLVCAGVPALFLKKRKNLSVGTTVFIGFSFSLLWIVVITFGYLSVYYHANDTAALNSQTVQMQSIDGGYFFDGPGDENALIFYPGAKVETLAYGPLMERLAENGIDCFLADMPFRMAFFGGNVAKKFTSAYTYEHWAAAGHSLGGVAITNYVIEHADQFDALILLASYPNAKIPDTIKLCFIYGTKDGCLGREVYEQAKKYWPMNAVEYVMEGGNHAQYGNYGVQAGDLEPDISYIEQQELTAAKIQESVLQE